MLNLLNSWMILGFFAWFFNHLIFGTNNLVFELISLSICLLVARILFPPMVLSESELDLLYLMDANGGEGIERDDGSLEFENLKDLNGNTLVCNSMTTISYYARVLRKRDLKPEQSNAE